MSDFIPRFSDPEEKHCRILISVLHKLKDLQFKKKHTGSLQRATNLNQGEVHFEAKGFSTFMFTAPADGFLKLVAEVDETYLNRVEFCFEVQTHKMFSIRALFSDTKNDERSWDFLISDTHLIDTNTDIIPISHFTDNAFQYCTVTPLVDLLLEYM